MDSAALSALSPVDGRYRRGCRPAARGVVGERPHSRARAHRSGVAAGAGGIRPATPASAAQPNPRKRVAATLALEPGEDAPAAVKAIESRINHDVKAVEYFVRDKLTQSGATPAQLELVHFGCTSEDINNLAYARMLRSAARTCCSGELEKAHREAARLRA